MKDMHCRRSARSKSGFGIPHFGSLFAIVIAISLTAMPLCARPVEKFTGRVCDQTGSPLPGALVEFKSAEGRPSASALTGRGGEFALEITEGDYFVSVTLAGMAPIRNQAVTVMRGMAPLFFTLGVPSPEQQVVVTATMTEATLAQVGGDVTVISGRALSATGISNVAEALRSVAGMNVVQTGSIGQVASLFLRGGESKYTKVLVDGIPINEPGGGVNFANLSTAAVDRIEVVRGPQSALFGSDAIAGVVQIFTRRGTSEGRSPSPQFIAEAGNYSSFRYAGGLQGRSDRVDYAASFMRMDTDNNVPNSAFNEATVTGNLGFRPGANTEVRTVFRSEAGRTGVPGQTVFHRADLDQYSRHRNLAAGISLTNSTARNWTQHLSYAVRDSRQFSANPADSGSFTSRYGDLVAAFESYDYTYQTLNQTRRQKIAYQSDLALPRHHLLTAGAEYERESGVIGDPSADPLHAVRNNYAVLLQDQWSWRDRLFTGAGVRFDHNQSFGFFAAPRASVAFHLRRPAPGSIWGLTKLRGNFGLGIKEPSLIESYSDSPFFRGNPNLRPEKSTGYDAGVEQTIGNGALQVTWFENRYRDQIGFVVTDYSTYAGTFFNLGKARARGIEAALRQGLGVHWEVSASYTLLNSRVLESASPDLIYAKGNQLLRRPRHSGFFDLRWKPWARLTLGGSAELAGSRLDSDFSGLGINRNPGYGVLNVLADFRLAGSMSVFAVMRNALDRSYTEVLGYPALGRNFRIGIRAGI